MNNILDRANKCEHKNLYPNYCVDIPCSTPYCRGYEVHCMDCGAYISKCLCHSNDGISGWSFNRNMNWLEKQEGLIYLKGKI